MKINNTKLDWSPMLFYDRTSRRALKNAITIGINPKNIKKYWKDIPDNIFKKRDTKIIATEDRINTVIDILNKLKIDKEARGLDIGGGDNSLIKRLRSSGFNKFFGIDANPAIKRSHFGIQMNFRDLPSDPKFDFIHFSLMLDYFKGGCYEYENGPMLSQLLGKIDLHLKPKGILLFYEDLIENRRDFIDGLQLLGFKEVWIPILNGYDCWKKPRRSR